MIQRNSLNAEIRPFATLKFSNISFTSVELKIYIMSFVHKYRYRNRSSSILKLMAKITQVIDSQLWQESLEEPIISKIKNQGNFQVPPELPVQI